MSNPFLGRIQPPPDVYAAIRATLREAPCVAQGPLPKRSPPLWYYRHPRPRAQQLGCCVGESGAAMCETTFRTPQPIPEVVAPVAGTPAFSPLWVYWVARQYSRDQGRQIVGEGAIVSDALQAVAQRGLVLFDAWPATPDTYRAYSDARPPDSATRAPKLKIEGEARRLTSADLVLEYLAAGYSVQVGLPWRGGHATAPDGKFRWSGSPIGGHAVELLGYDLDLDAVWVGNSWDNAAWGVQPADPTAARGYGYCRWTDFARDLTPAAFASGVVEAVVITEVDVPDPTPPQPPPPVPPEPTPSPAAEGKVTVFLAGQLYTGSLRPAPTAPPSSES